jgi:2-haloacid dehalogenase
MNAAPLNGIRACVFDAYGTLFDTASAAARAKDRLGDKFVPLAQLWRDKQLQYTWLRAAQGRHADFWQVTGDALDFALETLGIDNAAMRQRLMELYLTLDPFPEVATVLTRLKQSGIKIAILSNGTPAMLEAAVRSSGIEDVMDAILSVEEAGVFKPHPKVYQLAVDRLGVAADAIAFVSGNGWDIHAASAFGMRTVWCNRTGQKAERLPGKPDRIVTSLAALPAVVGL